MKTNTLITICVIIILIITSSIYLLWYKNLAFMVAHSLILISMLYLPNNKSKRLVPIIAIIILILFSFLASYEEIKEKPYLDIIIHSVKVDFPMEKMIVNATSINLMSIDGDFILIGTEIIKGENTGKFISGVNPLYNMTCVDCYWYTIGINKKGKINFPIYFDFFSEKEVFLYGGEEPGIEFRCGNNVFSKGKCLLTIEKINKEIKLVFYSKRTIDISLDSEEIKYKENIRHSKMIHFYGDINKYGLIDERGNKIIFPSPKRGCTMYRYNNISKKFIQHGSCN